MGSPLAGLDDALGLGHCEDLVFAGWDLSSDHLAKAVEVHRVLEPVQVQAIAPAMELLRPWPAVGDEEFCRNVSGVNTVLATPKQGETGARPVVRHLVDDLDRFRATGVEAMEVILGSAGREAFSSTERGTPLLAALLK